MRNFLIVALFFLFSPLVKAQDPVSSQYYFNQLNMNPAYAGYNYGARFGGTYRNQWNAIPGKFVTYNCWSDIYTPAMANGGLGIIASKDVSGEGFLKTTNISIIQSFQVPLDDIVRFRIGYKVGMTNKRIDWDKLVFSDQIEPINSQINPQNISSGNPSGKTFSDISIGGIAESKKIKLQSGLIMFAAGYALNHILKPNESLNGSVQVLPIKHTIHITPIIELTKDAKDKNPWSISPNFIYERQGNKVQKGSFPFKKKALFSSYNVGIYIMHAPIITGFFYRKRSFTNYKDNDALILFLGLRIAPVGKSSIFRIGYSYDLTINEYLSSQTNGAHEISLSIEIKDYRTPNKKSQKRRKTSRNSKCPDFGTPSILFR